MPARVMILEDDPYIALDMEGLVEDAGYKVMGPVATPTAALRLIADNDNPDCALLDFHVTGGTTEVVARELDRLGVPYMFLTANARDVAAALPDCDPLIHSKPVRARGVLNSLKALLTQRA